jgi:hypothetical protein
MVDLYYFFPFIKIVTPNSNIMNPQYRLSPSSPNQADSSYAYVDSSRVEDNKMDDTWVNSKKNYRLFCCSK